MSAPGKGTRIGRWYLVEPAGSGGMATVWRAENDEGVVAIKILHEGRLHTEETARFRREYATLARLDHPGVVKVYDTGQTDGWPWIAMALVDGPDLATLEERWRVSPPPDRFERIERIFRDLCDALGYVHRQGVIHRDLKPQNVLVDAKGRALLTDFGVVRDPSAFQTNLTMVGRLVGTVAFMAPEQITGELIDARTDLYSLGAILYVMLTGTRPIQADTIAGYLARHLTEVPRPPSELDPAVPRRLEAVCLRLLEKDPVRRYPTAADVLVALDTPTTTHDLSLAGRDIPYALLTGRCDAIRDGGTGGVVAVLGPRGSGRTRILRELVTQQRARGMRIAFAPAQADTLRILRAEMGDTVDEGGGVEGLKRATRGRPWVVVVDDIDRGPASLVEDLGRVTWDLVAVDGVAFLLIVSADVSGPVTSGIVNGTATGLVAEEIVLGGLDREALRTVLRERGITGAAGATLAKRLHEEVGGLPGPVVEQLGALVSAGWLLETPDGGLKVVRSIDGLRLDALPLPDRVRAAEAAFLRLLEPTDRLVLEALAVLDTAAPTSLVAPLTALPDQQVQAALAHLTQGGHLLRSEEALQELYRIPGKRRAQVVYESIPAARRIQMHTIAAELVQRTYRRRAGAVAELAARHLVAAGDAAAAYPLLVTAAIRAQRRGEDSAARALCLRALEARPAAEAALPPLEAARLRRQLFQCHGDAIRGAGRLDQARDAYTQALIAARAEGDASAIGKALASAGLVALAAGRVEAATGELEEALGSLERGDSTWPEAANALALTRFESGNRAGARALWEEIRELGIATRNSAAEIQGLWGRAISARAEGRPAEAVEHLERAISLGLEGGAAGPFVEVLRQRAELALEEGDWNVVLRLSDEIEGVGEKEGVPATPMIVGVLRAAGLAGMGETADAVRAARSVLALLALHDPADLLLWAWPARILAGTPDAQAAADRLASDRWMPAAPFSTATLRAALRGLVLPGNDGLALARSVVADPGPVASAAVRLLVDAATALRRGGLHGEADRALTAAQARVDERLQPGLKAAIVGAVRR